MEKIKTKRREFLRLSGTFFVSGLAISSIIPIFSSCERDETLPLAPQGSQISIQLTQFPELLNVPSIAKIKVQKPVQLTLIVKRITQTDFLVFSSICPHQGVELDIPAQPDGNIHCPQHDVEFSTLPNSQPPGYVVSNPLGVKVGNLPLFAWEFDPKVNTLIVKFS
ncbi:MAG: Rieske 2Fe-2S domain-containing protein [Candidatus Kapaibacteriales bacterium]